MKDLQRIVCFSTALEVVVLLCCICAGHSCFINSWSWLSFWKASTIFLLKLFCHLTNLNHWEVFFSLSFFWPKMRQTSRQISHLISGETCPREQHTLRRKWVGWRPDVGELSVSSGDGRQPHIWWGMLS